MKASTARSIETLFWLGVWGMGIWWFATHVLPIIQRAIENSVPSATSASASASPVAPAAPSSPASAPSSPFSSNLDLGTTIAGIGDMAGSLLSMFSSVSQKAVIDSATEHATQKAPSFDSTRSFQRWLTEQARARSRATSGGSSAGVFGPGGSSKEDFFRTGEVIVY